ncbi:hypothetical protein J167_01757 [Xanthomonas citri pv. citri]|nr:hypothetical protein J165_01755 [Xanthomonas citri pv. citri]AJZ48504.1 hypothetical protein J166_01758 [Xanthomonas citri pv. citri]AJZ53123.1 hypothetical protein J167_01757 [Xanthomonas citri pv. citri]AJZ65917.1 hypothetical protein J168_01756 [Xanthomonas citri pv. citri]
MTEATRFGCLGPGPEQSNRATNKTPGGSDLLRRSNEKWVRFKSALTQGHRTQRPPGPASLGRGAHARLVRRDGQAAYPLRTPHRYPLSVALACMLHHLLTHASRVLLAALSCAVFDTDGCAGDTVSVRATRDVHRTALDRTGRGTIVIASQRFPPWEAVYQQPQSWLQSSLSCGRTYKGCGFTSHWPMRRNPIAQKGNARSTSRTGAWWYSRKVSEPCF